MGKHFYIVSYNEIITVGRNDIFLKNSKKVYLFI